MISSTNPLKISKFFTINSSFNDYFICNYVLMNVGQYRKSRDELSHNIFLLVQECNKFREHQARETFIKILETQLRDRQTALKALKDEVKRTDDALTKFEQIYN